MYKKGAKCAFFYAVIMLNTILLLWPNEMAVRKFIFEYDLKKKVMMSLKKVFSLVSILALLLISCVPEDGDTGPSGPVGAQGAFGPAGQDGTNGSDGNDGTNGNDGVNGTTAVTSWDYTILGTDWNQGRSVRELVDITSRVVEGGVVQVYRQTVSTIFSDTIWTGLPVEPFGFGFKQDSIVFMTPGFSGASFTSVFRVIVIPPAVKITGVDITLYDNAKMIYGLEN
ncbi:MAG: hypothetical protein ACI91R_000111 [Vicingaceae bacterium]